MTDTQILKKAIDKAVHSGWDFEAFKDSRMKRYGYPNPEVQGWTVHINAEAIIFNHDFAKAFFGTHTITLPINNDSLVKYWGYFGDDDFGIEYNCEAWEYHLQQMVLQKEPLKYIEKFL